MNNPWLTIPLEDYESHMALPDVGQAKMLANEFEELLNLRPNLGGAHRLCWGQWL